MQLNFRKKGAEFNNLGEILLQASEVFRASERLSVVEAAEKYRFINNPGSYVGPYNINNAPYLREVMDELTNPKFETVCFSAPAQSGKTSIIENSIIHTVKCDPSDMIIYQTSKTTARDFVISKINKLLRDTPELKSMLVPGAKNDAIVNKIFKNGCITTFSWPSINELSGKSIRRVFITDYDRVKEDIDGEGNFFSLARKRTTAYRSKAKVYVESSPGYTISNSKYIRKSMHEAPPCSGILSIHNQGDRRLLYWQCIHCRLWFVPEFSTFRWPKSADLMESAEAAYVECPHCRGAIQSNYKYDLNIGGKWLKEGQSADAKGVVSGDGIRSSIASFWLKGAQAAFSTWIQLIHRYLSAEEEYLRKGTQEDLKVVINTDFGDPYTVRGVGSERTPESLIESAQEIDPKIVPNWVRFLFATVDVQKNRFVCQVFGVGPASKTSYDIIVIDRFDITKSARVDEDGDVMPIAAHAYVDDWWLIKYKVIDKTYPIEGFNGEMGIRLVGCDSGGADGVTANAYSFWRELRRLQPRDTQRFTLLKGGNDPKAPRSQLTYPDSQSKDRKAGARGEIPVLMLNGLILKDKLNGMLDARQGSGAFILPRYLPDEVFSEMCAEIRTEKGWEKPKSGKAKNEAWDLGYYCLGLCSYLKVEYLNWDEPPSWARIPEKNTLVFEYEEVETEEKAQKIKTKKVVKSDKHDEEKNRLERLRMLGSSLNG